MLLSLLDNGKHLLRREAPSSYKLAELLAFSKSRRQQDAFVISSPPMKFSGLSEPGTTAHAKSSSPERQGVTKQREAGK
jgi:hypothetical protein